MDLLTYLLTYLQLRVSRYSVITLRFRISTLIATTYCMSINISCIQHCNNVGFGKGKAKAFGCMHDITSNAVVSCAIIACNALQFLHAIIAGFKRDGKYDSTCYGRPI